MSQYFEPLLAIFLIASAIISLIDIIWFEKPRKAKVLAEHPDLDSLPKKKRRELLKAPLLADYARSLFPVFLIVFILRGFIFGLFVVPTGSMLPTIQLDEFLYVNKLAYNIDWPIVNRPMIHLGSPKRGEVAVFHYPAYPNVDYIKTIVGLPGDTISYVDKQLYINGKKLPKTFVSNQIEPDNANLGSTAVDEYKEKIGQTEHTIFQSPDVPAQNFVNVKVPKGYYFAMGDNRDNSDDSRYWGFVPASYLVGKASFIFFSWNSRHNTVRWDRLFKAMP